ncbi:hypothetical protein BD779DRAFT_1537143 [Infundibulicybe gibba]|nr:hypothetical protein BD779DRAFT_1537143 [Infundibulicybe gibba]
MFVALVLLSLAAASIAIPSPILSPRGAESATNNGIGINVGLGAGVGVGTSLPAWYDPKLFLILFPGGACAEKLLPSPLQKILGGDVLGPINSITSCYCGPTTSDPAGKGAVCQQLLGTLREMGTCGNPADEIAQLKSFVKTACSSLGGLSAEAKNSCKSLEASFECTSKKILGRLSLVARCWTLLTTKQGINVNRHKHTPHPVCEGEMAR